MIREMWPNPDLLGRPALKKTPLILIAQKLWEMFWYHTSKKLGKTPINSYDKHTSSMPCIFFDIYLFCYWHFAMEKWRFKLNAGGSIESRRTSRGTPKSAHLISQPLMVKWNLLGFIMVENIIRQIYNFSDINCFRQ